MIYIQSIATSSVVISMECSSFGYGETDIMRTLEWQCSEVCNEDLHLTFPGKQEGTKLSPQYMNNSMTAKERVHPETTWGGKWQCDKFIL